MMEFRFLCPIDQPEKRSVEGSGRGFDNVKPYMSEQDFNGKQDGIS